MTALVCALMDDVFVTQVTYVDENSARVLMHISHADFDVLEKADWFSQITDVNFISWQDIDTEPDPDNGQPEGGFAYILRMAKNSCMTEETIEYFVRKENGEWLVDLDETARLWMENDKSGAAPEVFAASFGLIDHDYAQERYYAYEEYAASLDGEEIETDWNVWLTLTAPTGTDRKALNRLRGYSLTGADEMILNAPDYYFTDGSCEWYSCQWMEEETLHAALEIKIPGEVSAETVKNALSGATLVCQAESWPLSIRCYHSTVSVDLTSVQYTGNRLEDCEITFEYAHPKKALTQKQSDRLDEKGATFAEFLYATSGEYCSLDSVYDLWPGVPPEVLNAPYLEAGYTVYYLEGPLGRQDTSYGLHDLTFQALNAPDGVYVRRARECGMCDAIDGNDFWPGCGGNVRDVCVLVRDDAGDTQQLLRELQIEASCSVEWLTYLEDSHNRTYRIGPRFTIKTDTSGVVITGDNELALKTDGLLKKAEPLVWTAAQFESLFRVDTAVAEDMAARPENRTHYRLTLTASAKTPMPFEISGIEWEYQDDYQRYSVDTVNDFSDSLFVSSAPLGGKEAVADGSLIELDLSARTTARSTFAF